MGPGGRLKIVIGCGTGRSGTHSLNDLLNSDPDIASFHEGAPGLPWVPDDQRLDRFAEALTAQDAPIKAHVGYWHLNYIPFWVSRYDARIVGLIRGKNETVQSMVRSWNRDMFDGSRLPHYPGDMAEAAGRYWEDYTRHLEHFAELYPANVGRWALSALNDDEARGRIVAWAKRA